MVYCSDYGQFYVVDTDTAQIIDLGDRLRGLEPGWWRNAPRIAGDTRLGWIEVGENNTRQLALLEGETIRTIPGPWTGLFHVGRGIAVAPVDDPADDDARGYYLVRTEP